MLEVFNAQGQLALVNTTGPREEDPNPKKGPNNADNLKYASAGEKADGFDLIMQDGQRANDFLSSLPPQSEEEFAAAGANADSRLPQSANVAKQQSTTSAKMVKAFSSPSSVKRKQSMNELLEKNEESYDSNLVP